LATRTCLRSRIRSLWPTAMRPKRRAKFSIERRWWRCRPLPIEAVVSYSIVTCQIISL
jgi:hypothetical protein